MSFQNLTWLYWALPLIALPVVIHLINQYRHRTVKWAAMMFLLNAKRMTSGMARLRQILILAMRTLVVAGLVFAVARPLASGWLGLAAGGAPDTVMVLLDRSASMEQQNPQTGMSKRSAALEKLREFFATTRGGTQLVLVESTENLAREIESMEALLALPETGPTATAADVPAMLEAALGYVTANQTGRTDIWLCSDLRENDWDPGSGRWEGLQSAFAEHEAVQFYLLNYDELAPDNLAVSIDRVARREIGSIAELTMDVRVSRLPASRGPSGDPAAVGSDVERDLAELPVALGFVIDGVRSVHEVVLAKGQSELVLQGHGIPVDRSSDRGWGRVELPGDFNPIDNAMYFVFAEAALRRTVLVSDDPKVSRPLQAAAGATADPAYRYLATVVDSSETGVAEIDWEQTALLLWQAAPPAADSVSGQQLQAFVAAGRTVLFFPPAGSTPPSADAVFGLGWGEWSSASDDGGTTLAAWRRDSDLLADTQDGAPLPLGELRVYQWREPVFAEGAPEPTVLGRLAEKGLPMLLRVNEGSSAMTAASARGGVYVCTTLPQASHSNLARDGVVLFAALHRALERGAEALSGANQKTAGRGALDADMEWTVLAAASDDAGATSSSERGLLPGIFSTEGRDSSGEEDGIRLVAINRPLEEDSWTVVGETDLDALFAGLKFERITLSVDDRSSLVSEIWRAFLIAMALALVIEAFLCLPALKNASPGQAGAQPKDGSKAGAAAS